MKTPTETILIVDDEESDVEFLRRAFLKAGVANPIHAVSNGEEAIAYLCGNGTFADRARHPYPRVIITDLKMPQMDGIQLLQWLQENPPYRVIPTIVFTSSTAQSDVNAAFEHGAGSYIVKPVEYKELERIACIIADYWRLSLLPQPNKSVGR